jgi:galactose mutarotase-like enzyme
MSPLRLRFRSVAGAVLLAAAAIPMAAAPYEFVLSPVASVAQVDWEVTSTQLGIKTATPFAVRQRRLHGGRQEGVDLIEIDNGRMQVSVIPTRGMSLYKATVGDVTLGWNSPVTEIVNPAFVNLESRGGLGWLDGFNELMVRCGVEWAGHPGVDQGRLLTLHGRIGNIPASRVTVVIDDVAPHRIYVRGAVTEQTFKFADFLLETELSTEPGSSQFRITDTLTNRADYEREFQLIYHGNFGPPLLGEGTRFVAPTESVTPFDEKAEAALREWATCSGPTAGFGEHVYMLTLHAGSDHRTAAMLRNASGDRAIRLDYDVRALPCFTLWKNTDTLREGYVIGLEPGTGFPSPRANERAFGRVPKLAAGTRRTFAIDYTVLVGAAEVAQTALYIAKLQDGREPLVVQAAPARRVP